MRPVSKEHKLAVKRAWLAANKDKLREYQRRWRSKNREKVNGWTKAWVARNPEKRREIDRRNQAKPEVKARRAARMRRWRRENPEREREIMRRWRSANLDTILSLNRAYRARKHGAGGASTVEQIAARVAFYGGCCAYCGGPFEHLDHVIPISRGGTNWPANFRPACRPCNSSKRNRRLAIWLPLRFPERFGASAVAANTNVTMKEAA